MSECDDEDEDEEEGVVEVAEQNSVQQIHPYTQSQDIEASNKTLDSKVPRNYDPEKKLAELFYQIDKDHSGLLTRLVPELRSIFFFYFFMPCMYY